MWRLDASRGLHPRATGSAEASLLLEARRAVECGSGSIAQERIERRPVEDLEMPASG